MKIWLTEERAKEIATDWLANLGENSEYSDLESFFWPKWEEMFEGEKFSIVNTLFGWWLETNDEPYEVMGYFVFHKLGPPMVLYQKVIKSIFETETPEHPLIHKIKGGYLAADFKKFGKLPYLECTPWKYPDVSRE